MARPRQSRFRSNGVRRKTTWGVGPVGQTAILSATSTVLIPNGAEALLNEMTITRTRGQLMVQLITADAALSGFEWAFGMCIVSQNAFGIGVTAVPDPLTDIAWDGWFVYETGFAVSADASPSEAAPGSQLAIPIDSKAMRKINLTDTVVGVIAVTEIGTSTIQFALATRLLLKLA